MTLSKKELGMLIKQARREKSKRIGGKFTQKDLANAVNKSRSYIGDLETGRTYPSYPLLSKIAEACGVPLSFFQADVEGELKSQLAVYPEEIIQEWIDTVKETDLIKLDFLSGNEKDRFKLIGHSIKSELQVQEDSVEYMPINTDRLFKAPILGSIPAGQPIYAEENIEGYMYVDPTVAGVSPKDNLFYLRIIGESMTPKYQPGDLVLIRQQAAVDNGDIAAVLIDNCEACLKKVYILDGEVWLHSTNPAYEPIRVSADSVKILGKAMYRLG
jgi:repressor LexA